jgi:tripartite-type tricarboxylate transporter receptor subunit TctC
MDRRRLLLALPAWTCGGLAYAQDAYPARPVHVVVPFLPGSPPDLFARAFAEVFGASAAQPVIVENVQGAAGNIAAERLAQAAPDGHTLGVLTEAQVVVNPALYRLRHDPAAAFAPVSQLLSSPNVLVIAAAGGARSIADLVARAKAQPGALTFASGGSGTTAHLAGELFKTAAHVDIRHVPYKGILAAAPDLVSGRVTLVFSPISIVLPMVREGRLRALAITSPNRSAALPETPTMAEAGYPACEISGWNGLFVPAGTPAGVIATLNAVALRTLARSDVRSRFEALGLQVLGTAPGEFAQVIHSESARWSAFIRQAGIHVD